MLGVMRGVGIQFQKDLGMENGGFRYGPSVHGVKRCLVARMIYIGTKHLLHGKSVY